MGNGVALLPYLSVDREVANGDLVRIPVRELRLHRELRIIYRRSATLSHAAGAFLKVVEKMARQQRGSYRFQRER
jgi:DNA-binding transcriptional LysR family regulator